MAKDVPLDNKGQVGYSKVDLPTGFETEDAFVEWVRKTYEDDLAADDANRRAALEDSEFMAGEQWDETDAAYRKDNHLPTLTLNQLPAFVGTVVGNRRLNEVTVNVAPDNGASRGLANLREGITRSVLKNSVAKRALDKAFENQVICGIGNFSVGLDYANNDVFEQDICVKMISHALAVVWDRFSLDPTGRDAHHVFEAETVKKSEYEDRWPNSSGGEMGAEVDQWARANGWLNGDDRRVLTVWRMNEKKRTLAMFTDGVVKDITDLAPDAVQALLVPQQPAPPQTGPDGQPVQQEPPPPPTIVINPKTQQPMVREAPVLVAQRWVVSANEILEGPYELPIDRVPIFRCTGWEVNIGNRRVRWGLVRLAKDAQRLFNFWRSVVAEKLLYSPKATVMGPASAFEGRKQEWRDLHTKREPLEYNDDTPQKPEFIPPPPVEIALLQQASLATQDMRDVLNLHEANLGLQSNEVSAKAITARQKLGEMGTVIYNDNMNAAVEELGRVINQLIPVCYDTPRTIKVTSVDDKEVLAAINSGENNDVTIGQYSVTLSTGPSYVTKRAEAAEAMLNFINAAPQVAAVAPDLIVEAQDWPNAEAIAARFRRALPPNLLGPEDITPEQAKEAQQNALMQQHSIALETALKTSEIKKNEAAAVHSAAMAQESSARGMHARAQAASTMANADTERMKAVGDLIDAEHNRLAELWKVDRTHAQNLERDRVAHEHLMEQGANQTQE